MTRFDLDHAFTLHPPANPEPQRAPVEAKSFLIFRSCRNFLNDFANLANPFACRSVWLKFEVRVQVLELPRILAPAPLDVRQHKVSPGKTGLPQHSLSSTFLGLLRTLQAKNRQTRDTHTFPSTPPPVHPLTT